MVQVERAAEREIDLPLEALELRGTLWQHVERIVELALDGSAPAVVV